VKEVSIDYASNTSALDRALHKIKEIFDGMTDLPELGVMNA
jgi:hypothetical protein